MRSLKQSTFAFLCLTIAVLGCAANKLSPMQKRQITTRFMEAPYEDVFRATLTVLQDKDFNIKNTDMETGLIVADVVRELHPVLKTAATLTAAFPKLGDETETTIEERWDYTVSCLIAAVTDSASELRITIHKVTHSKTINSSSDRAEMERRGEVIYDKKVYQDLFDKISVEVKRRQAVQ